LKKIGDITTINKNPTFQMVPPLPSPPPPRRRLTLKHRCKKILNLFSLPVIGMTVAGAVVFGIPSFPFLSILEHKQSLQQVCTCTNFLIGS
jgi:hypothetical protein